MHKPAPPLRLREVTRESLSSILRLAVAPGQEDHVADNATSIAQAHFDPKAWFRGIYCEEEPVGFVMLRVDPEGQEYYLWRFMIGAPHQGMGYGRRAMELIVDHVRALPGAQVLSLHVVDAPNSALPFYEGLGFLATGEIEDGELVMELKL